MSDMSDFSMQELFRIEAENQTATLTEGLLSLERDAQARDVLESLMRAAHSIKGAARIINLEHAVRIAHQMEECFVAAQNGQLILQPEAVDILLQGVDMLNTIAAVSEQQLASWQEAHAAEVDALVEALAAILQQPAAAAPADAGQQAEGDTREAAEVSGPEAGERELRLSSERLDHMLALASEMQVAWQWLEPFGDAMTQVKRHVAELENMLIDMELSLREQAVSSPLCSKLRTLQHKAEQCHELLLAQQTSLELHSIAVSGLSHRLYHQTVAARMRPFADAVAGFQRMVRDLARRLGKQVRLEVDGLDTMVDRDILERIKAPLNHLVRNAIDHGIESPELRRRKGKREQGEVRIEARHQAGMLRIVVSDDGQGLDLDALRDKVVARELASEDMVARMSETELMAFLFLPKFTMKQEVTEISGRGVGLDVVANMVREVRGTIHSSVCADGGMRFELRLPITLSVIRALLVEIGGEAYAFPLVHIERTLKCHIDEIASVEGSQYIHLDEQQIGLVSARHVLGLPDGGLDDDLCPVVLLGPMESRYGLIVDRFLGECDLVEKALHPRLGKVQDISSGAISQEGEPVLIFDVNDLLHSIGKLVGSGRLGRAGRHSSSGADTPRKRVLVVDDSLTVREVERKLLLSCGYDVDVAVDGVDGLNTLRASHYDLLISDVDMPRMDGIELVSCIKADARLRHIPVIIVSYKESDEDRMRGLQAGADAYLTKSSFHDETLTETVTDLIGPAS